MRYLEISGAGRERTGGDLCDAGIDLSLMDSATF
jgi:hypothetical protein